VLGKSYFDLARAIYRAGSFDDLVDLLVAKLPSLIGADEALVMGVSPISGLCSVSDHGPIARVLLERMEEVNRLTPEHPLWRRVDFDNPGDIGFALSDFVSPEEYRQSGFVRQIFGETKTSDVLFGMLVQQRRRKAYLKCYFSGGSVGLRSEEHTSELQSHHDLVCRLLLEKKKTKQQNINPQMKQLERLWTYDRKPTKRLFYTPCLNTCLA